MIADLAVQTNRHRTRETDVLIVGAGIAGLILAIRLRSRNVRVVVLESGGREQTTDTHPLNRTVQLGDAYSGATQRFRCLGGTSTRWGGALIPFIAHDLAPRPYLGLPGFPVRIEALGRYLADVEKLFGLDEGSYDEEFVDKIGASKFVPTGDPDFNTRFAKWPPFKNRNVAILLKSLIERDQNLEIWINSTATSVEANRESGRIISVTGREAGDNRSITVTAKHVVICAGAIESTRLLLLFDRQYDQRPFAECSALGHFFNDHISIPVAKIRAKEITKLNRMAGFRFFGSTMRSLRFELSAAAQEREGVGSAFGHISFKTEKNTGFDTLRQFLRSLQRSGRTRPSLLLDAARDLPYLVKMCLWRAAYKQLLWPVPAIYELHVVAEQLPRANNYIALSSEQDCFKLPVAAIRWQIAREDLITFTVFKRRFDEFWNRHGLQDIGDLNWTYDADNSPLDRISNADVYHPAGSTRMGTDQHAAVVDANLRSFAVANLWVASTSVFPSGGGENPTLMLMLFTMRLADHLSSRLKVE